MKRRVTIGAILIGLVFSSCGDDDKKALTSPAPPDTIEAPQSTPPPSAAGQLPPEFLDCLADQGHEIRSPAEIHSAPPEVLQACFGSLHSGATP